MILSEFPISVLKPQTLHGSRWRYCTIVPLQPPREHQEEEKQEEVKVKKGVVEKSSTGMKRKVERDGDNNTNESHPKAKTRKYFEGYVALGFTVFSLGKEERPVCLLCLKMLAAASVKLNKQRRS